MKGKEWGMIIGMMIVIAIVASLLTANLTGNIIRTPNLGYGANIYTKADIDKKLAFNVLDPTSCNFNIATMVDPNDPAVIDLRCKSNQVIGMVTNGGCPLTSNLIVWGFRSSGNNLPFEIDYTCVNPDGGIQSPEFVYGYCCDIKSTSGISSTSSGGGSSPGVTSEKIHRTSVDSSGKVVVT